MWNCHYCLWCRKQVRLQSWKRFNQKCPQFNGAASGCSAVAMATLNGNLHDNLKSICKRRSGRPLCLQYLVSYDLGQHPGVYSKQSRNLRGGGKKQQETFLKMWIRQSPPTLAKHGERDQVQSQPSLLEATVPKTWRSSSGCTRGCSLEPEGQTPVSAKHSKDFRTGGVVMLCSWILFFKSWLYTFWHHYFITKNLVKLQLSNTFKNTKFQSFCTDFY